MQAERVIDIAENQTPICHKNFGTWNTLRPEATTPIVLTCAGIGDWTMLERTDAAHQLYAATSEPITNISLALPQESPWGTETYRETNGYEDLWELNHLLAAVPQYHAPAHPALAAFGELKQWLRVSDRDLAHIARLSKGAVYHWAREGSTPRPSTVARLYRLHTLVRALSTRMSRGDLWAWLNSGSPSRLEVLRDGDLTRFESAADLVLTPVIAHATTRTWVNEDESQAPVTQANSPREMKPQTRGALRGRLS